MLHATIFTVILLRAGFACLWQSTDGPAKTSPQSSQAGMTSKAVPRPASRTNTAAAPEAARHRKRARRARNMVQTDWAQGRGRGTFYRGPRARFRACWSMERPRHRALQRRLAVRGAADRLRARRMAERGGPKVEALLQQWKTWLVEDFESGQS